LLLGLPKPKAGVRPIAIGECITQTAASFGLQRVLSAANEYFAGVQYVLLPGRAEVIIHDIRRRSTAGETIVTIDFGNVSIASTGNTFLIVDVTRRKHCSTR